MPTYKHPCPYCGKFIDKIVGGTIPREYIKPIDQGIREALETGPYAGYPMVDVKVTLFDGSFHEVDSSEMAFRIAASMAPDAPSRWPVIDLLELTAKW